MVVTTQPASRAPRADFAPELSLDLLTAASRAVDALAGGFVAHDLRPVELRRSLEVVSTMHNQLEMVRALVATAVAETRAWEGGKERSAAELIAKSAGTSLQEAKGLVDTGSGLRHHRATEAAARRGELSGAKAHEVTQGAKADPGAEQRLLDTARQGSLGELKDERRRVEAAADPDPEATRRRVYERRCLRTYADADGTWHLHVSHTQDTGVRLMGALRPHIDAAFEQARRKGRHEHPEAYAVDGLVEALCGSDQVGEGPKTTGRPKYIVRIDHEALCRGRAEGDEVCEVAGLGPVSVATVRALALEDDPFWAAIVTRGYDVLSVAHLGRQPNAFQRTALEWLFPTCAVRGCNQSVRVQWDHREDWRHTHHTTLAELDGLCAFHHRLKTTKGWMLVDGSEPKRDFVPPGELRHPKFHRQVGPPSDRAGPPAEPI